MLPPLAVNIAVSPLQIVNEFTVTVAEGLTITLAVATPEHPGVLSETVYEVGAVGVTVIVFPDAPVDQT